MLADVRLRAADVFENLADRGLAAEQAPQDLEAHGLGKRAKARRDLLAARVRRWQDRARRRAGVSGRGPDGPRNHPHAAPPQASQDSRVQVTTWGRGAAPGSALRAARSFGTSSSAMKDMMIVDVFGNAAEPRWGPDEPRPREPGPAGAAAGGADAARVDLGIAGHPGALEGDLDVLARGGAGENHEHLHAASSSAGGTPAVLRYMK